jgi:hypothetical protein
MAGEMAEQVPVDQGQAPQEAGGDQLAQLVQGVGQGISTLAEIVGKTPDAPPEAAQLAAGMMEQFQQLIQVMSGGGQPQQSQAPQAVPVQQAEGTPVRV